MPNVPTVKEATDGQITNLDTGSWFGLFAPAGTPQAIVDRWAKKPLDFAPGTQWQYSNTGYVVAGMIAEKAADMIRGLAPLPPDTSA